MSELDSSILASLVQQIDELRSGFAQLRQENLELRAENAALRKENAELKEELRRQVQRADAAEERVRVLVAERDQQATVMATMNAELVALRKKVYGRQSEKMPSISSEVKKQTKGAQSEGAESKQKRKENRELRKALQTVEVQHKVKRDGRTCPKCGAAASDFKVVGEGTQTDVWEYIPARFQRQVHVQETLACPCGEHLVTAEGPKRVVEGGNYGPGFVANLLVAKGCDSMPFYRLEKQFARLGIPVARSTMARLFHLAIERHLHPLASRILELIREAEVVLADETPLGMQRKPDTGKAGKGYVWTFNAENLIAYRFSATRSGETPKTVLGGTTGTLLVDAYSGYNRTCSPEGRERAGCLAHARRAFFEAKTSSPEAQEAMDFILGVYLVEHEAVERAIVRTPAHLELRKEKSAPVMRRFHQWLLDKQGKYPPRGPMGKAIAYSLDNWKELTRFLKSEQIPPDNNRSERALRVVALYRKNSLFVGDEEGGQNLADLLTILATCAANGVNPLPYLTDILPRVAEHPNNRIDELLPQNWKPPPEPDDNGPETAP